MEYVIPAVILLLLISGFVTFLVLNATRKSGPVADRGDEGAPGIGSDPTPLGDTTEHAGEQSRQGVTRDDPESGRPSPAMPATSRAPERARESAGWAARRRTTGRDRRPSGSPTATSEAIWYRLG